MKLYYAVEANIVLYVFLASIGIGSINANTPKVGLDVLNEFI